MEFVLSKDLLKSRGLNMTTLAEKVGMSRGGLYTAIKNKTITAETIINIANVLDVDYSALLEGYNPIGTLDLKAELDSLKEMNTKLKESYNELLSKFDNLSKINSLNEKLVESAAKRVLLLENTFGIVDNELYSLSIIAKPYVKAIIKSEFPQFNTLRDPQSFLHLMDEDPLNLKIESIKEIIIPLVTVKALRLK